MDVNEVGNRETKLKVIEANSWFIEKSDKMDKPLSRQKKKQMGNTQINNIRKVGHHHTSHGC